MKYANRSFVANKGVLLVQGFAKFGKHCLQQVNKIWNLGNCPKLMALLPSGC